MTQTKNVVITGILGQDGSYMADHVLENTPHRVFGMMRHYANPNLKNVSHLLGNPRFSLVEGDLTDTFSIEKVVKDTSPDYFFNFGANSFVKSSWDMPEHVFDVNAMGVLRIMEALRRYRPTCRFYTAGSSEEWGDVVKIPQNESHPPRARSPYGASKVAARQICKVYRDSYSLYAVSGWLLNHESNRRAEVFVSKRVTKGVARIAKANGDCPPLKLGCLSAKRDWSHATDFMDGVWRMLNQEEFGAQAKPGKPFVPSEYVLASGETHEVREFVELAFACAGIKGEWVGNTPESQKFIWGGKTVVEVDPSLYRPAEVDILLGDSSKIRRELGWMPKYTFRELVQEMVDHDIKEAGI